MAGAALRSVGTRIAWFGGGADPRLRSVARRAGGSGCAAGLGADADRTWAEGSADFTAIGSHVLRASDATGEQGAYPYHFIRSTPAAGDQLQLRRHRSMRRLLRARCALRAP